MFQGPETPFVQLLSNVLRESDGSIPKRNKIKSFLVYHFWRYVWLRHFLFRTQREAGRGSVSRVHPCEMTSDPLPQQLFMFMDM